MFPVCTGLPRGPYRPQGNTCPWPVPGFLCRRHRFVLISFMITEKIPDSCHQTLAVPLMTLVYPERVSDSTRHTHARLSPAVTDAKNVTAAETPVRTKEQKLSWRLGSVGAHACSVWTPCSGPRRGRGWRRTPAWAWGVRGVRPGPPRGPPPRHVTGDVLTFSPLLG